MVTLPDDIKCIDLKEMPSFYNDDNYHAFAQTETGQMVIEALTEQMREHTGNDDFEFSSSQAHRALARIQTSQESGSEHSRHIVSAEELEDIADSGFSIVEWAKEGIDVVNETIGEYMKDGVGAIVSGVTTNSGMSGNAADKLQNRKEDLDNQIKEQQDGPKGMDM